MERTTSATPKFSVLICNYNYARYVGEAVESCLSQTYTGPFEIIVVDDGSTDDSLSVLERYRADPRVTVVSQANGGQAAAFARGIECVTGDYVCLLDADDLFEREKLSRVAAKLATYPVVPQDFFLCHDLRMAEQPEGQPAHTLAETWFQRFPRFSRYNECLTINQATETFPFAVPCGTVFSTGLLRRILDAMPLGDFRISADTPIFWAAMLAAGAVHYLHEPLATYRAHGANLFLNSFSAGSGFKVDPRQRWPKHLSFLENFLDTLDLSDIERNERLALIRRLQGRMRVSAVRPRMPEPRMSVLVYGSAPPSSAWTRTLRSVADQTHRNVEIVVPRDDPSEQEGEAAAAIRDTPVQTCEGGGPLAYLANAYAAARGEYFTLVAAGDCLDRTFAERHLYMHRYASLCMVTSSDFRLTGARGELVHEACLWSTGICRGTSILRPFERSLDKWSFSPRSANVFRRWPAIDCFFASLREVGNETTDGWGEWLLLYFAQALGGSCRWGECLSTLAVEPGDNLQGIARGLPLFGRYPGATTERARAFLFALLCAFHRQLLPTLGRAGVQGFVRWLAAEAAPPARAGMRSRAMTAGMGAEVLTLLGDGP